MFTCFGHTCNQKFLTNFPKWKLWGKNIFAKLAVVQGTTDKMKKDKLDIAVDTYKEFITMLQKLVKKEMIASDKSIDNILGKSRHLVSKKIYNDFTATFIKEVKAGKFEFLEIIDKAKSLFYIKSLPDWINHC